MRRTSLLTTLATYFALIASAQAVDYPIVCVRSVRPDDTTYVRYPEVFQAVKHPPSDLVVRQPDGRVTVLVSGGGVDALFDPKPSLDGAWVYFVREPECEQVNKQRGEQFGAPVKGADIWRVHVATGQQVRVTDQHWTPPGAAGRWARNPIRVGAKWYSDGRLYIGYGVYNLGPCPLPGGRLAFTSNRRGYESSGYAFPNTQLFILDDMPGVTDMDGELHRNVECTGFLNVSAALHPVLMQDGRLLWSSHEAQGKRDHRLWSLWQSYPDGREWGPMYSALSGEAAWHFHGQRSDGSIFATLYYNLNNNGFGTILESPLIVDKPEYLGADQTTKATGAVRIGNNALYPVPDEHYRMGTQRRGLYSVTPWTHPTDAAAGFRNPDGSFTWTGKVTHPSAAPHNEMLLTYSPGPANNLNRPVSTPRYDMQVALVRGTTTETADDLEILLSEPGLNFTQPAALVSWSAIHGDPPAEIPFLPNPTATPFGVVGSSSAHIGQWKPVPSYGRVVRESTQGFWSGIEGLPAGIDIVGFSPRVVKTYGASNDSGWSNAIDERCRILARILFDEPSRTPGDTSWAAEIPADVPFTFRTFDETGRTITFAQTWHQVRPGEHRLNCGGCHNHSGEEVKWDDSWFVTSSQVPKSFDADAVRTPEFNRDVLPIFEKKCWSCHDPAESQPVKLDATIATSDYVVPGKAYQSRLSQALHGEGQNEQTPHQPTSLTSSEQRLIDEWIDYWCLVAEPGKADFDESPPTLYVPRSGELKIGAHDYQSGLTADPVVTFNSEDVDLTPVSHGVWATGLMLVPGDVVVVTATDRAGNHLSTERFVNPSPSPGAAATASAR